MSLIERVASLFLACTITSNSAQRDCILLPSEFEGQISYNGVILSQDRKKYAYAENKKVIVKDIPPNGSFMVKENLFQYSKNHYGESRLKVEGNKFVHMETTYCNSPRQKNNYGGKNEYYLDDDMNGCKCE